MGINQLFKQSFLVSIMRKLTANQLLQEYQNGKRGFSNISITSVNLENVNFSNANFGNSDFTNTTFARSNLSNADFSNCRLQRTVFEGASLKDTRFDNSDMQWAILKNAFFENTSLKKCKLSFAHLCKDDLAKADLRGADLSMACLIDSKLTEEQLKQIPSENKWNVKVDGIHDTEDAKLKAGKASYAASSGIEYGGRQQGVEIYKKNSSVTSAVYGIGGTTDQPVYNTQKTVSNDPHDAVGAEQNEYISKKQEEIKKQQDELKKDTLLINKKLLR